MKPLDWRYKKFLDYRICRQYEGYYLLGSAIILKTMYIAVIEKPQTAVYFIIDNVNNPQCIDIKASAMNNPDGYIRFNFNNLKKALPAEVTDYLLQQGLFMTESERRKDTALASVHRLAKCLDTNIKGLTADHADRNRSNNWQANITPMTQADNNTLRNITDTEEQICFIEEHRYAALTPERRRRCTVQSNTSLHLDIIRYAQTHSMQEVIQKYKAKIKTPQTIRNIVNLYKYASEFFAYLDEFKFLER